MLTAGQIHGLACAQDLIENADLEASIAGKAYDADALIDGLAERESQPQDQAGLRFRALPRPQSHRALLQQD
jgi:hypothetical protein